MANPGLVSVIVPCFNQALYTELCLASLARFTRPPWELIAVDNGSTDETPAYLRGFRDAAPVRVEVLTNSHNLGFPAACNQGLAAARGDFLVLLNNDAVVTEAWADHLIALVESDPPVGMVGPMSNYARPPQLAADARYDDLEGMHRFAAAWRESHRGQWFETEKLSGFCLLLTRRVLETVGTLDEQFGIGTFEDDDLSLRARRAGFTLAVARDLFVHHFGSRTFADGGLDTGRLLEENARRFVAKWGERANSGRRVLLTPCAVGDVAEDGMPIEGAGTKSGA